MTAKLESKRKPKERPHPGKILLNDYLEPRGLRIGAAAKLIGVTRQALYNIVNGKTGISPDMAARLGLFLGLRPETIQQWQKDYELNRTRVSHARSNRGRYDSYFIVSSDLVSWADTVEARYTFPQLIRMLVHAITEKDTAADFPAAYDVQRAGWDGLVENTTRNAFVPLGRSAWELSTQSNPQRKAELDYEKRKQSETAVDQKAITYVAVSARRWADKREWVKEKRAEKFWANVLAYDAVDLEQWFELCPEVGIWFTSRIGRRPRGVQSLDSFWNDYRLSTTPSMTPDLLLAGRNSEAETLNHWLEDGSGILRILADSAEEALAFAAAASLTNRRAAIADRISRIIVASDIEHVRQLVSVEQQLTFAWHIDDPSLLGSIVDEGHRAILPLGRSSAVVEGADIELPRLARNEFVAAISGALSSPHGSRNSNWEEEAAVRARKSGRSITVYRRLFPSAGAAQLPLWARVDNADDLIPVVLAGSWSEGNDADRLAIAKLATRDYGAVSRALNRWRNQSDAPIRRIGEAWMLAAPLDAWSRIACYIGEPDLQLYRETVLDVLSEVDPQLSIAPDERLLAAFHGKQFKYSTTFREGLAESLILFSVIYEETQNAVGATRDRLSSKLVTQLLGNRSNPTRWASLSGLLPRLAEAAPEAFLGALEEDLSSNSPDVVSLFEPEGASWGSGARHPHLLWALELTSWYPEHLPRAASVLAKLDGIAPDPKIANRPSKSLGEIFCTWHRNTAASLDERLEVIDRLLKLQPTTGWNLLLKLLPKSHDVSGNVAGPRWRAKPDVPELTYGEIWRARDAVISRAMDSAGNEGPKLSTLIPESASWPLEMRSDLLTRLEYFLENSRNCNDGVEVWHTLRRFVAQHRAFPNADWSIKETEIAPFEHLVTRFEPTADWESSLWLFDQDPPRFSGVMAQSKDSEREVSDRRQEIITEIVGRERADGLLRFAGRVKLPWLVGRVAAEVVTEATIENDMLDRALANNDDAVRKLGLSFVFRRRELMGSEWSDKIMRSAMYKNWPATKQSEFCLSLPEGLSTWEIIAGLGSAVEAEYWRKVTVFIGHLNCDDAEIAISKLLQFARGLTALEQAAFQPDKLSVPTLVRILQVALGEIAESGDMPSGPMLQYHLEQVFRRLRANSEIALEIIAGLEWQYLPLLRMSSDTITLFRFLQRDPVFFARLVTLAFKAEPETDSSDEDSSDNDLSNDQLRLQARAAWDLLNSWNTPPGLQPDGTFDPIALTEWIAQARSLCAVQQRSRIGDDRIGHVLARVPEDRDGAWPHVAVRKLIEEAESQPLEVGIHAGRVNSRGAYARNPFEGGRTEREIARQYRNWAKIAAKGWSRTAGLLNCLADTYEQFARVQDITAEHLDRD